MKKSLVALAALAVVGAASAQSTVTLSGKLAFAYKSAESAGAVQTKANGLGVTDGDFVLTANEDLGGGMKAIASMAVKSRGRTTTIEGRDASLTIAGGFGSVMVGAVEASNGILGLGGAGAPTIGMDGAVGLGGITRAVLSAASNTDILMYTSPNFSGFTVSAAVLDATTDYGMESTAATQDATLLRAAYAAGPVAAMLDYTNYGLNAVAVGRDSRTRLSGSYDLGVVKLGAGYESIKTTAATDNGEKQYLLGVSAPVGAALTVGANYARNRKDGVANTDVTGYELGANYALSKRTGVQVAYQSLQQDQVANRATTFRVRLMHSF